MLILRALTARSIFSTATTPIRRSPKSARSPVDTAEPMHQPNKQQPRKNQQRPQQLRPQRQKLPLLKLALQLLLLWLSLNVRNHHFYRFLNLSFRRPCQRQEHKMLVLQEVLPEPQIQSKACFAMPGNVQRLCQVKTRSQSPSFNWRRVQG